MRIIASHCVSLDGIAFSSVCDMCVTCVFHTYHIELVADLYHTYRIASNHGPGIYFFPATFHPGH